MRKRTTFYDPSTTENSRIELNEYRKNGKFSDFELRTPNGECYHVHKVILALSSPYFEERITATGKILQLDMDISESEMDTLLDYLYMGKVNVTAENARALYDQSQHFELPELLEFCQQIIIKYTKDENCLEFYRHAVARSNTEIRQSCLLYIADNIETFFHNHLLELNIVEFVEICSQKQLIIKQEKLFENILKWIKDDLENRDEYLMQLIEFLNFDRISNEFLEFNIITDEIWQNYQDFQIVIMQHFQNHQRIVDLIEEETEIIKYKKHQIFINQKFIYLICNKSIDKLDLEGRKRMKQFTFDNCKFWGCAATSYQNNIYITGGGCENDLQYPSFEVYDSVLGNTRMLPAVKTGRFHRLAAYEARIYACGGYGSSGAVEIYDIRSSKWMKGPKLKEHKYDFALSVRGDCMYAVGGYVSPTHNSGTVERLDFRQGDWYTISQTPDDNFRTKAVLLDDALYCIGVNSTGRIYDLRTNKWRDTVISSDGIRNSGKSFWWCFDVACHDEQIFGIFQNSEDSASNTTWKSYKYDRLENVWLDLKKPLHLEAYADINLCVL